MGHMNTLLTTFEARDTGKYGEGVFATEGIRKGETIFLLVFSASTYSLLSKPNPRILNLEVLCI